MVLIKSDLISQRFLQNGIYIFSCFPWQTAHKPPDTNRRIPCARLLPFTPFTVCFGARDDSYGVFRTPKVGNIITFKLTYKSGYVTCHPSNPGCLWNRLIPNQMATLITDKNRNLLLPKSNFLSDYRDCKFYSLPWATTESPQLLFDNFSTPLTVETNQEFQIWYSEDLFKWGYGDNGYEKTCVAVYGLYV